MSTSLFNLVVELPGTPARYYQLNARIISIGRSGKNAVVISEDAVSSCHCELRQGKSGFELSDLGSTNGTRLNGIAIDHEARPLHDGDVILLGLTVKARFVRVIEIKDKPENAATSPGSLTKKLEKQSQMEPAINPVAAAMAKAAKAKARLG